jgi:hypothetical protein
LSGGYRNLSLVPCLGIALCKNNGGESYNTHQALSIGQYFILPRLVCQLLSMPSLLTDVWLCRDLSGTKPDPDWFDIAIFQSKE